MEKVYARIIQNLRDKLRDAVEKSSQSEVARLCQTTPATIQRILSGKRGGNLPFKTILTICLGLGIDLGDLAGPGEGREKIKTLLSQISKLIANE